MISVKTVMSLLPCGVNVTPFIERRVLKSLQLYRVCIYISSQLSFVFGTHFLGNLHMYKGYIFSMQKHWPPFHYKVILSISCFVMLPQIDAQLELLEFWSLPLTGFAKWSSSSDWKSFSSSDAMAA